MSDQPTKEPVVTYVVSQCVIAVHCATKAEADAVTAFATAGSFTTPAPANARPVYHCHAKTHPNGEVLWG
ncbi:MAG: hypothetical protein Q7T63_04085 [Burkholderiaceae bacterium]|jgi:hypothetical protein|nr:hypothetical protein [Burkholderiaceae bacterium]MDP3135030.1 hypothetical protein [Burkholderiaceae bacterium]